MGNFYGMNVTQREEYIINTLKPAAEQIIQNKFVREENAKIDLSKLVGQNFTVETVTMQISPNKELVINTKGDNLEQDISSDNTVIPLPK
jgi:hypothetical protein